MYKENIALSLSFISFCVIFFVLSIYLLFLSILFFNFYIPSSTPFIILFFRHFPLTPKYYNSSTSSFIHFFSSSVQFFFRFVLFYFLLSVLPFTFSLLYSVSSSLYSFHCSLFYFISNFKATQSG